MYYKLHIVLYILIYIVRKRHVALFFLLQLVRFISYCLDKQLFTSYSFFCTNTSHAIAFNFKCTLPPSIDKLNDFGENVTGILVSAHVENSKLCNNVTMATRNCSMANLKPMQFLGPRNQKFLKFLKFVNKLNPENEKSNERNTETE